MLQEMLNYAVEHRESQYTLHRFSTIYLERNTHNYREGLSRHTIETLFKADLLSALKGEAFML